MATALPCEVRIAVTRLCCAPQGCGKGHSDLRVIHVSPPPRGKLRAAPDFSVVGLSRPGPAVNARQKQDGTKSGSARSLPRRRSHRSVEFSYLSDKLRRT